MCWFGCRDSKIQGFPKPLIARSCEDASMRGLGLPLRCLCLVGPVGPRPSSSHPTGAFCFSPMSLQRLGDPKLPLPNSAQGSAPAEHGFTFRHCTWNSPLLNPEITADLPRGEISAWKMRTSLRAETADKDTKRGGYFPSCTRLALCVILHESL